MNARSLTLATALALTAGCGSTPTMFTTGGGDVAAEPGKRYSFDFDDGTGPLPGSMSNVLGEWSRVSDPEAPSAPNVLRQGGEFATPDYPRLLVNDLTFADLTMKVRCRVESGGIDRACGIVFRAKDSENYYITRANSLEDNVRLYRVVAGSRMQLASANRSVTSGQWHTLEASAIADELVVRWDGEELIRSKDGTYDRGKVGLWTKADSITSFDDLEATEAP
jgi:hypothetical protein